MPVMKQSILLVPFLVFVVGCGTTQDTTVPTAEPPIPASVKKAIAAQLELGDPITNSIGMVMVRIPAGEFQMGSSISVEEIAKRASSSDLLSGNVPKHILPFLESEHPQHLVKIAEPFYLSENEVTQRQYEKVMGLRPWKGQEYVKEGPHYAATYVSWNDAMEFCRKLSYQEGVEYRLPTEAQWEYACRAGTTTVCSFGDDESNFEKYAWFKTEWYAHQVGQKLPNPWGLYDMHGNVDEWCRDSFAQYDGPGGPIEISTPRGYGSIYNEGRVSRVIRGGSIFSLSFSFRSASRTFVGNAFTGPSVGFRVLKTHSSSTKWPEAARLAKVNW